jgi:hypothetical protein
MQEKIIFNIEDASDASIETYTRYFIEKNIITINNLCFSVYKDNSQVSILAFQEIIFNELKKACYSFVNNNHNPNYIDSYLFSCIYKTIKNMNNEYKHNVYICPGCKYFSKIEILKPSGKNLICNTCKNALNSVKEKWEEKFYTIFSEHNKKGFQCPECENFIPNTGEEQITCPYPNCFFVGPVSDLKSARHPTIKANLEIPFPSEPISTPWNNVSFISKFSEPEMTVKEDLNKYIDIIYECIDSQITLLHYKSNASTLINKLCMYQAFKNIINKYPEEMISYLVFLNRTVRIQHKIFQEFVRLLEEKIPFSFKMNGKFYEVVSLLDENLCIFSGESEFKSVINDVYEIPNETEELYVGGRKGTYCRPYYIGKLLDVVDIEQSKSIMENVKEYSFFKITMNENVKSGTNVLVKHLRICSHYQMGALVYLQRIRRIIVDKVYFTINGRKRPLKH